MVYYHLACTGARRCLDHLKKLRKEYQCARAIDIDIHSGGGSGTLLSLLCRTCRGIDKGGGTGVAVSAIAPPTFVSLMRTHPNSALNILNG